jgi:hypothetical protein
MAFEELRARREAVMFRRRAAVEEVARQLILDGGDLTDALIAHADQVRDALAAFDSGVRGGFSA